MGLQQDMKTFECLYEKFSEQGYLSHYMEAAKIIGSNAARYKTAQYAGGLVKIMAAGASRQDSLEQDLSTLRVENNVDYVQNQCRADTLEALRKIGLTEEFMAIIEPELNHFVGTTMLGEKRDIAPGR